MQNLRGATRLPSAVFTFNVNGNLLAVKEARTVNLPIFSLSDSTSDTSNILYPLPGNDDAVSSITFCSVTVSKAILVGRLAGMSKYMRYKKIHSTF
jgi:small subunit ribosomal protein S2